VDETYIGGKARNMHKSRRQRVIKGTGMMGKTAVMGLLERHSKRGHSTIRVATVPNAKRWALQAGVRMNVEQGATIHTDALSSYKGLDSEYVHNVIDHAEAYVDGQVHTNGCENFWSLLKRGLKGTYVAVEPFHLFRYLDEQAFRFNERGLNDAQRFENVLSAIVGRRLMYADLIAASGANAPA
jgi:transposase-like protein